MLLTCRYTFKCLLFTVYLLLFSTLANAQIWTFDVPQYGHIKILYQQGDKHLVIQNTSSSKKTKVTLPGLSKDLSLYSDIKSISNTSLLKIRLKSSYVGGAESYMLMKINQDGSYRFLLNSKNNDYIFTSVEGCHGFVITSYDIFNAELEPVQGLVQAKYSTYYDNDVYECFSKAIKLNFADGSAKYYNSEGKLLSFTTSGKCVLIYNNNYLITFDRDSAFVFDITTNDYVVRRASLPDSLTKRFLNFTGNYEIEFEKRIVESGVLPAKTADSRYEYVDFSGNTVVAPFNAELALPYFLPANQAPVQVGGKWGVMDKSGNFTTAPKFSKFHFYNRINELEFHVGIEKHWVNEKGILILIYPKPTENNYTPNAQQTTCTIRERFARTFSYKCYSGSSSGPNVNYEPLVQPIMVQFNGSSSITFSQGYSTITCNISSCKLVDNKYQYQLSGCDYVWVSYDSNEESINFRTIDGRYQLFCR
ncbi:MAG: hypothetical protein KIS94_09165 [Chitinophagales bacterium]|nr:hypothetical protein [Chitinophagales bacterium]